MALEITDKNFKSIVENSAKLVVLDFWAQWCGPCKTVSNSIDLLAKEYDEQVIIGKVDVDINPELVLKFGVRNMPTVLYMKNGEVLDKHVGSTSKIVLEGKLKANL